MKKFTLNADDFAKDEFHNSAVIKGAKAGLLKSASIMTSMPGFDEALKLIKELDDFSLGVHLNIIEGKALNKGLTALCDKNGNFNNGYLGCLIKSNSKKFLSEVELEFRSQIEKVINITKITHLDSHVHIHSIPNIFKIVKKLALEYNIPYIRTQAEIPYFIKGTLSKDYLINLIKTVILNYFTLINRNEIKNTQLKTNDYILGVSYTGMMSSCAIYEGLKKIKKDNVTVEALIHPAEFSDKNQERYKEFEITRDIELIQKIQALGFEIEKI